QFNDLRNGNTTIHSWDIIETTERQKKICLLLLKNRRKSKFGKLDGNPLSITHFKVLDASITEKELIELVELDILKEIEYEFEIIDFDESRLSENELLVLSQKRHSKLFYDDLMTSRFLKLKKVKFSKELETLKEKGVINCVKSRYEFKNKKISSGLFGINRIFLPSADAFPTLVASDTNDYITLNSLNSEDIINYRKEFLDKVYYPKNYRKLTKEEACKIQGFPSDFKLPESRARWMKLIGNSVSVPIIDILVKSIIETGAFGKENTMKFKITTKSESTLKQQDVRVSL
ncbi:MAG TPA: DNA cytosine methyltransferase, partial [Flavobacteriaceae bacterium]